MAHNRLRAYGLRIRYVRTAGGSIVPSRHNLRAWISVTQFPRSVSHVLPVTFALTTRLTPASALATPFALSLSPGRSPDRTPPTRQFADPARFPVPSAILPCIACVP